ncbi:MAG: hypothetical protein IPL46_05295 [Saprospiraceae bacterium]|nr:hypothetical protein [Saprospiraceae bacterium]
MKSEKHQKVTKSFAEIIKDYRVEGKVPDTLKEEVFKTIETIELAADILDLFTLQFARSEASFIEEFQADLNEDDLKEGYPEKLE